MSDIYKQLANHLNQLPGGFPPTDSGVELRILKHLFSPEEARIAVALSLQPESVESIASKLEMNPNELGPQLLEMSLKGLIFRMTRKEQTKYMAAQFVIGIWEYHVNDLDEELIKDFNEYVPYLARQWTNQKTKQLRVIPISRSLNAEITVMPYEVAEQIIAQQSSITVAPCICRKEHKMAGKGCDYPMEVCLCFGSGAYFYEQNGLGRRISQQEALDILKIGMDAGLVLQPGNSQKAMNICMCCGCCCQVLKNLKSQPKPAQSVNSSYQAKIDQTSCIGCGVCAERCHMQAVTIDETAQIDLDRCIGCGVCIPTCEAEAISLFEKPAKKWVPPATVFETYMNMARERGLI